MATAEQTVAVGRSAVEPRAGACGAAARGSGLVGAARRGGGSGSAGRDNGSLAWGRVGEQGGEEGRRWRALARPRPLNVLAVGPDRRMRRAYESIRVAVGHV